MSRRVAFAVALGVAVAALLAGPMASGDGGITPQTCRPPQNDGGSA